MVFLTAGGLRGVLGTGELEGRSTASSGRVGTMPRQTEAGMTAVMADFLRS